MLLRSFHLPFDHLSATSLTEFLVCPEQFRLKRIAKRPERNRLDLFIGTVHHRAIADLFRNKIETGGNLQWEELAEGYRHCWDNTINDEGEPEWEVPPSEAYETGTKVLECFLHEVAPYVTPLKVEQRFEETVPGVPVPVVGYIDVESRGFIEEFKTSARKEASAKPRWRFQGRIYQLAVDKPVAWYVTTKQVTPKSYTPVDNPGLLMDPANKDQTVRLIVQSVEVMNDLFARYGPAGPWPTNGLLGEWACKSGCSFGPVSPNPICPAWRNDDEAAA